MSAAILTNIFVIFLLSIFLVLQAKSRFIGSPKTRPPPNVLCDFLAKMAQEPDSFDVNVKDFQGGSVVIKVYPSWNVSTVKQEIASRTNVNPQDFRIVFAGQTLSDNQTLWDIGLQGYSTLHCIRDHINAMQFQMHGPTLNHVAGALGNMTGEIARAAPVSTSNGQERAGRSQSDHRFYVYCKKPCADMAPGKLRVRCADCKDSSFVLTHGPGSWDDVLDPRKLHGQCNNSACGKHDAEFFFKCATHPTGEREDSVALHMVRANTIGVECATCLNIDDCVVVFACDDGHSLCVSCFIQYCRHQLVNRQFIQDRSGKGYTIRCPANCEGSEVTEIHHFRLMGKDQSGKDLYSRYQRFSTEECIIQMGGVLCPNVGCGQGLLPEEGRRIQCPQVTGGCGFVFCRNCKSAYHEGPCRQSAPATEQGPAFHVSPENLDRARWIEANERYIQSNTNIKPCPKCQVPIEKNGGCMHMTCTLAQCKFEWCWICGIEWNRNCQSSHWFG